MTAIPHANTRDQTWDSCGGNPVLYQLSYPPILFSLKKKDHWKWKLQLSYCNFFEVKKEEIIGILSWIHCGEKNIKFVIWFSSFSYLNLCHIALHVLDRLELYTLILHGALHKWITTITFVCSFPLIYGLWASLQRWWKGFVFHLHCLIYQKVPVYNVSVDQRLEI